MQLKLSTEKDTVIVPVDVTKIEVEDFVETSEDDIAGNCYRTIRFVGFNGESVEVFCTGFDVDSVLVHFVKELKPVEKPSEPEWLTPSIAQPYRKSSFSPNCPVPSGTGQEERRYTAFYRSRTIDNHTHPPGFLSAQTAHAWLFSSYRH
jgi:hypothetical protein